MCAASSATKSNDDKGCIAHRTRNTLWSAPYILADRKPPTPKYQIPSQRKMPKSCMKKRKVSHRVSFNKVVGVHKGATKKLKRVNATKLAYDVLKKGPINSKFMKGLVKKHKQHGSTKKAIQESIRTLHKMDMRVCKPKYNITTIGARYVSDLRSAMNWSDRLSRAKTVLKNI